MSAVAEIKVKADPTQLPSGLRSALKMVQGFVHNVTGLFDPRKHKDPDRGSLAFGSFIGSTASNLAMRGLDIAIDQGKKILDFNKELIRLGIDLDKQPAEMEEIGRGIRAISSEIGLGADKILAGGRAYADLAGEEAFTMDRMRLIARAAQASGTDVEDMAKLMFTLTENMKVPPGELEDTIGGLIKQAKMGSIHFRELAKSFIGLGAVFPQFGKTGREGVNQLGAMMQIAMRGFPSAEQAATGIQRLMRSIPQHAPAFEAAGVQVYQKGSRTKLLELEDIIKRIRESPLSLDRVKLIKAFGRTEGERFYQLLKDMSEQYEKLKVAAEANGVVIKDLGTFTESSAGSIDIAMERMKNAFADALTPERVDQLVGAIETITGSIGNLAGVAGKAMDAIGAIAHWSHGKAIEESVDKYNSDDAGSAEWAERQRMKLGLPTGTDARLPRQRAYASTIRDIMGVESDWGAPTNESVKRALRIAMSPSGGTAEGEGRRDAAVGYLSDRGDKISEYLYKRLKSEILAENNPSKESVAALTKLVKDLSVILPDSIAKAIKTPTITLDGSAVSTGVDNAQKHRRR